MLFYRYTLYASNTVSAHGVLLLLILSAFLSIVNHNFFLLFSFLLYFCYSYFYDFFLVFWLVFVNVSVCVLWWWIFSVTFFLRYVVGSLLLFKCKQANEQTKHQSRRGKKQQHWSSTRLLYGSLYTLPFTYTHTYGIRRLLIQHTPSQRSILNRIHRKLMIHTLSYEHASAFWIAHSLFLLLFPYLFHFGVCVCVCWRCYRHCCFFS